MIIPAIRGNIGVWTYYIANLTFSEITNYVSKVDKELHKSSTLSEMIQRSITDNYKKIKEYIMNQEERFFNSLVLAVYDGDPQWVEVELNYKDKEFFNLGFLTLTGEEKIFPVDGQHRVEGIKAALHEQPELADQQIPVIFIGHKNDQEGMQRTRRLFSTLNRYAKPVSMRDIIALDEDDIVAIVCRDLLENHTLFANGRILDSKGKAIPKNDKKAITSVITLYDCNLELFKYFKSNSKVSIKEYLKLRPSDDEINSFKEFCYSFWDDFSSELRVIAKYLENSGEDSAEPYRNNESGGHLLFRPVGLLPFIIAVLMISNRESDDFKEIIYKFNKCNFELNKNPWKKLVWNDIEKKMISGEHKTILTLLLIYMYDEKVLTEKEIVSLKEKYRGILGLEKVEIEEALESLKC